GLVTMWNGAAERLFGWRGGELQNRPPPVEIAAVLRAGSGERDVPLRRRDGAQLTCLTSVAPLRDRAGRIGGTLAMFTDITARLEAEAKLRQAQKMEAMGLLVSGVTHDFNNILTIILANGGLLRRDPALSHLQKHKVETMIGAARSGAALIAQLLGF